MVRNSLVIAAAVLAAAPALGAPVKEATFGDWSVYRASEAGREVCYAVTAPLDAAPKAFNHGDVFMIVSSWKGAGAVEPSFHAGYPLKPSRAPEMKVAYSAFDSFADENEAFIADRGEERQLVESMKDGATMRVEATAEDGGFAAYEFSLSGVTAAINRIGSSC
ncbi:MAG: hypothetical protein H2040_09085 [Euryhalocaulis sp.]|uniref:hypothetical protein n=1 Tax=Euryhalocaulis sp. TaxID=2744307 RepID=UPI0017B8D9F1|nr:hypothetical protein [Euryhalocaulis sp.]MBA4802007.1 hypothetical protein [Euryhalocaulis sp.]